MADQNFDYLCLNCMQYKHSAAYPCPYCGFDLYTYKTQKMTSRHLPPGSVLSGKYMVGVVLGEGGFGITYLAYDLNLRMKVAIKEYCPQNLAGRNTMQSFSVYPYSGEMTKQAFSQGLASFVKEARKLAVFDSLPGIVRVRDYFEENGTAYFVMTYVDGITLKQYLHNSGGRLSVEETLKIMEPVISSLRYVHREGLVHRDISPDNIMLTNTGQVTLIDFGAAREISVNGEKSNTINVKHGYAPIEQYRTHGNQGPWTDVYAICATIYRCLTGYVPEQAIDRVSGQPLKSLGSCGVKVNQAWELNLMRGLSIKPEERYQDVEVLHQVLYSETGVMETSYVQASPKTEKLVESKANVKKKRNPLFLLACVWAIVLLGVGSGYFVMKYQKSKADKTEQQTQSLVQNQVDESGKAESTESLTSIIDEVSAETKTSYNDMKSYSDKFECIWETDIDRSDVVSLTFVDSLADMPADAWDISENKDGSVMAWIENGESGQDLYVGAEGKIRLPQDAAYLFMNYKNVRKIEFNNCVDTSQVTDMRFMFGHCETLTSFDLSEFDTSRVKDMSHMFLCCYNLEEINFGNIDTSQVTDMAYMFSYCEALKEAPVNELNMDNVIDDAYMLPPHLR